MDTIDNLKIESMILTIRNQRVMLDSDLAILYEVETKNLNRQVRRNIIRFPEDFMFKLTKEEADSLRCQNVTSKSKGGRRYQPLVFTESGVAMLSSVLKSDKAALVNIAIMRTFIKLRSFLAMETSLNHKIDKLELSTNNLFKLVFKKLDQKERKSVFIQVI